jgi:DNA repair protein RadA/Sms
VKKTETVFVCQKCGHDTAKWLGKCPECGEWNSLVEEKSQPVRKGGARNGFKLREVTAVPFTEIEPQDDRRVPSGVTEFDRVLGGGIVPGTLVLIGGDPGIGKSTLLLQVADKLSAAGTRVLYVSGEESERQIKLRGERLAVAAEHVFLLPETNLENIFREIERLKPGAIIVDSIQTSNTSSIRCSISKASDITTIASCAR